MIAPSLHLREAVPPSGVDITAITQLSSPSLKRGFVCLYGPSGGHPFWPWWPLYSVMLGVQLLLARAPWAACGGLSASNTAWLRLVRTCACTGSNGWAEDSAQLQQPVFPAQPGTVTPFEHHVFVRASTNADNTSEFGSPAWPPVVER